MDQVFPAIQCLIDLDNRSAAHEKQVENASSKLP
jgi:hypothetical protein